MQKLKGKFSNSASLGKTVARGQTVHSKSFFIQPSEFNQPSMRNNISVQQKKMLPASTPKLSSKKGAASKTIGITNSISSIHRNRKKCQKLQSDLQTAVIQKSIKVNKMLRDLHHFSICMQEVKWLLTEGDKLIANYLNTIKFVSPQSNHTIDITQIAREFRGLVLRFGNIDKKKCKDFQELMRNQANTEVDRLHFSSLGDFKFHHQGREAIQNQENTLALQKERETKQNSLLDFRNVSHPMKQNVNSSNLATHFDNIHLDQPSKLRIERSTNAFKTVTNETVNVSKLVRQRQQWENQKQRLYEDIGREHKKVEELLGTIELLKSQITHKQTKIHKLNTVSAKTIEQLSETLSRLMLDLNGRERQFQLLKMAQCINRWQKMNQQAEEDTAYQYLKGDTATYEAQHKQKLEKIIGLQYEINSLLDHRKYLQAQQNCSNSAQKNQLLEQEYLKMLSIQALTIEQLWAS